MWQIINILRLIKRIPIIIKRRLKSKLFHKQCDLGENVTFSETSNCFLDKDARIIIGSHCDICCVLAAKSSSSIIIGHHTTIRGETLIGAVESIRIGNYVIISNNVRIYDNNNHPVSPKIRLKMCESGNFYSDEWNWSHSASSPVIIEDNVWIGERSTILKGVTIGMGSIVSSNSVVTKNVPPYTIVAGNPAVVVKSLYDDVEESYR